MASSSSGATSPASNGSSSLTTCLWMLESLLFLPFSCILRAAKAIRRDGTRQRYYFGILTVFTLFIASYLTFSMKNWIEDEIKKIKKLFNKHIHAARDEEDAGKFESALKFYIEALVVMPDHAKLPTKIEKLKKKVEHLKKLIVIDSTWSQDPETKDVIINAGTSMEYSMTFSIYDKLFPHQREGVAWMWSLFKKSTGGILGDDMGMGKTIQVATFLHGLFHSQLIDKALLIMPLSLMSNWETELGKWCPRKRVRLFHGSSSNRERALQEILEKSGVILTTYETAQSAFKSLTTDGEETIKWDLIILDEGHRIKDPSKKTSKAISTFQARSKFILSGTPILNNLKELWALLNYTCDGQLLGDMKVFRKEFEEPITRGQMKDATEFEKQKGFAVTNKLRTLIAPHFIRRLKTDISTSNDFKSGPSPPKQDENKFNASQLASTPTTTPSSLKISSTAEKTQSSTSSPLKSLPDSDDMDGDDLALSLGGLTITRPSPVKPILKSTKMALDVKKNDFVCWIPIEPLQEAIYTQFLISQRDRINEAIATNGQALPAIRMLRQITNHPKLLRTDNDEAALMFPSFNLPSKLQTTTAAEQSGKLRFLLELLKKLKQDGHRALIFSQSVKMLDLIEAALDEYGSKSNGGQPYKRLRMDGSINKVAERKALVDQYNHNRDIFLFLMTTQVGGVGITLTSADRVIIFDPAWNTAMDDQAADRVYRIGQTRNVIIYRLISSGTIEEKMYRKQVFKGALSKSLLGKEASVHTYFTRGELRELFTFDPADVRTPQTQSLLASLHSHKRDSYPELEREIEFLEGLSSLVGLSDHNLLYTEESQEMNHNDRESLTLAAQAHDLLSKTIVPKDVIKAEQQEQSARLAASRGNGNFQVFDSSRPRKDPSQIGHRVGDITLLTVDDQFELGLAGMRVTPSSVRPNPFSSKPRERPRHGNLGGNDRITSLPVVVKKASATAPTGSSSAKGHSPQTTFGDRSQSRASNAPKTTKPSPSTTSTLPVVKRSGIDAKSTSPKPAVVVIKKTASSLPSVQLSTIHTPVIDLDNEEDEISQLLREVELEKKEKESISPKASEVGRSVAPPSTLKVNKRRIIEEDDEEEVESVPALASSEGSNSMSSLATPARATSDSSARDPLATNVPPIEPPRHVLANPTVEISTQLATTGPAPSSSISEANSTSGHHEPVDLTSTESGPVTEEASEAESTDEEYESCGEATGGSDLDECDGVPTETVAADFDDDEVERMLPPIIELPRMSRKSIVTFDALPGEDASEAFAVDAGTYSGLDDEILAQPSEEDEEEEEEDEDDGSEGCSEASESELAIEASLASSKASFSKHQLAEDTYDEDEEEEEANAESLSQTDEEEEDEEESQSDLSFIDADEDEDTIDYDEHQHVVSKLIGERQQMAQHNKSLYSSLPQPALANTTTYPTGAGETSAKTSTRATSNSVQGPSGAATTSQPPSETPSKALSWTQARSKRRIIESDDEEE